MSISVDVEDALGVVLAEFVAQPVAALRDCADAAPFAVADLEHLADQLLRDGVALALTTRGYWFSTSCVPFSSWRTVISVPSRMSSGSKPVMTIGTRNCSRQRLVFVVAHDGADVARPEKSLHAVERRLEDRGHGRRDEDVGDEDGKIA